MLASRTPRWLALVVVMGVTGSRSTVADYKDPIAPGVGETPKIPPAASLPAPTDDPYRVREEDRLYVESHPADPPGLSWRDALRIARKIIVILAAVVLIRYTLLRRRTGKAR